MFLTYKYRLLPRRSHRRAFERAREASRVLYNAALEERISAWRHGQVRISKYDQFKSLTEIRAAGGEAAGGLADYASTMGRWPLERLDEAFKGFFSRLSKRRGAGRSSGAGGAGDRGV